MNLNVMLVNLTIKAVKIRVEAQNKSVKVSNTHNQQMKETILRNKMEIMIKIKKWHQILQIEIRCHLAERELDRIIL